MKILAIDTSGKAVSAAVAENGGLFSNIWLRHGKTHAEALMPCIASALSGPGLEPRDIGVFAVVAGPGSFTGLRIGASAIKALAYAHNAMTVGISTLDTLAQNICFFENVLLCPIMDARNGNVYQAVYASVTADSRINGNQTYQGFACLAEAALLSVGDAAHRLRAALEGNPGVDTVIFNGDAAHDYLDFFRGGCGCADCRVAAEPLLYQNAASAALLACEDAERGRLVPPGRLAPEYLNAGYIK